MGHDQIDAEPAGAIRIFAADGLCAREGRMGSARLDERQTTNGKPRDPVAGAVGRMDKCCPRVGAGAAP